MKKILSIALSLMLFSGSIGITMGTHICGDRVLKSEWLLGRSALDCGMEVAMQCPVHSTAASLTKKGCCDNVYLSIPQDQKILPGVLSVIPDFIFITCAFPGLNIPGTSSVSPDYAYPIHSPPVATFDRQVRYQSFLI